MDLRPRCRHRAPPPPLVPVSRRGDLDMSLPAFKKVTGLQPDRVKITWQFAECGNQITGPIRWVRRGLRWHQLASPPAV